MRDPFFNLARVPRSSSHQPGETGLTERAHAERAHSKFSASAAERWFNCPGSVELSEGMPDKTSIYAEEGTKAHEYLEAFLRARLKQQRPTGILPLNEMGHYVEGAAEFILDLYRKHPGSEVLVEDRIYLDFIHPEMFGTFDSAIVDYFGTLHVFDFKYGAGHPVSVQENLQMIFYGIGVAHKYQWNFKRIRLWIIQPRIKGYDGPVFWEVPTMVMKSYVDVFRNAVDNVLASRGRDEDFQEGPWCHWCKAKSKCPLKEAAKLEKAKSVFNRIDFENP